MLSHALSVSVDMLDSEELPTPTWPLPNEIWLQVFQNLGPYDVLYRAARTCKLWRSIVYANNKRLPLFIAHCQVYVMDIDTFEFPEYSIDGRDPMINYRFSLFDEKLADYAQKRRSCVRGNATSWRHLHISHNRYDGMYAEWEFPSGAGRSVISPQLALSLMRLVNIEAMKFVVRKQGRRIHCRLHDEFFSHAIRFCEEICGRVNPKCLLLSSQNTSFPWSLGENSMKRLIGLRLDTLVLENMTTLDVFGKSSRWKMNLSKIKDFCIRFDVKHKQEIENMYPVEMDGSLLCSLAEQHVDMIDFSAFADSPSVVSDINAIDMCLIIKQWRSLATPWLIKLMIFNNIVTIGEFRSCACKMGLYEFDRLLDIPYCRFRTDHPSDPNILLELSCYGNGLHATQWCIRSGPKRKSIEYHK